MSLVHDALQKADRERRRRTAISTEHDVTPTAQTPGAGDVKTDHSQSESRIPTRWLMLTMSVSLLALIVALLLIGVLYINRSVRPALTPATTSQPLAEPTQPISSPSPPTPAPVESAAAPSVPPPAVDMVETGPKEPAGVAVEYVLTGIMKDSDGSFLAILNNRMVAINGFVDGATVSKIDSDRIVIEVDGKARELRLNAALP